MNAEHVDNSLAVLYSTGFKMSSPIIKEVAVRANSQAIITNISAMNSMGKESWM